MVQTFLWSAQKVDSHIEMFYCGIVPRGRLKWEAFPGKTN